MCGISGFLLHGIKGDPQEIARCLLRVLNHRGPDGNGIWSDESIVLTQNRLAIIDLSDAGAQPMVSKDGNFIIVFNGEIYNYNELRKKYLPDFPFRGHSDTEVLLELLALRGTSIIPELNGMFAFALWDKNKKKLLLVRDHMGIKPLYYYYHNGSLIFASEIKAILPVLGYTPAINAEALENYFTFCHALAPRTIYQNIFKLPHSHYAVIDTNKMLSIEQYWDVLATNKNGVQIVNNGDFEPEIDRLIDLSVKRQLIADVDVGIFLSGGIDSSALVAYASKYYPKKLKTFSVGFEFEGYNELSDAKIISQKYGTEHHEISLSDLDLVPVIEKLVYHYDEPFGDAASFPTYLLSEFTSKHVKVALSGEGGDEVFGGYNRYVAEKTTSTMRKIPGLVGGLKLMNPLINRLPRLRRLKKIFETVGIKEPSMRYGELLSFFNEKQLSILLKRGLLHSPGKEAYQDLWNKFNGSHLSKFDTINWLLYADQNRWMVETYLEKLDKASMAVSLESRVPLLDIDLVSFMAKVPGNLKIQGNKKKALMRNVLKKYLPEQVLNKPKHGFSVPTDRWFRGKLFHYVTQTINDSEKDVGGIINFPYVNSLIKSHKEGKECHDSQIWLVLNFCLWYQRFKPSNIS